MAVTLRCLLDGLLLPAELGPGQPALIAWDGDECFAMDAVEALYYEVVSATVEEWVGLERARYRLLRRADDGDKACLAALAAAGEALGCAVANLITLFAPPKVIITGRAMASSEHFMRPLRETVATLLPPSLADVSDLVVREWDDSIWARGAAAMTLRELYGAPWGTTGPAPLRVD